MIELLRQAPFRNAYLGRGVAIWVGVRMLAAGFGIGDPNPAQELLILGLVGGLVAWDARRRNEDLFLANLGVPGWASAVLGALAALPLEVLVP